MPERVTTEKSLPRRRPKPATSDLRFAQTDGCGETHRELVAVIQRIHASNILARRSNRPIYLCCPRVSLSLLWFDNLCFDCDPVEGLSPPERILIKRRRQTANYSPTGDSSSHANRLTVPLPREKALNTTAQHWRLLASAATDSALPSMNQPVDFLESLKYQSKVWTFASAVWTLTHRCSLALVSYNINVSNKNWFIKLLQQMLVRIQIVSLEFEIRTCMYYIYCL